MDAIKTIGILLYMALGYWAAGKTIYANKIIIEYQFGAFFMKRLCMGSILGWILIPLAVVKTMLSR